MGTTMEKPFNFLIGTTIACIFTFVVAVNGQTFSITVTAGAHGKVLRDLSHEIVAEVW